MKPTKWCPYISKEYDGLIHIYDPMYRKNFYCMCGVTENKFIKRIKKLGLDLEPNFGNGRFIGTELHRIPVGLIWSKDKTINLSHEIIHASVWALSSAGVNISSGEDEPLAYYHDFLTRCITKK